MGIFRQGKRKRGINYLRLMCKQNWNLTEDELLLFIHHQKIMYTQHQLLL